MGSFWCSYGHCVDLRVARHWVRFWLEDNFRHSRPGGLWCPHLDCGSLLWGRGGDSREKQSQSGCTVVWGLCGKGPWFWPPKLKLVQPSQGCWDIRLWVDTGWGTTQAAFLRELTVSLEKKDIHVGACSRTPFSHT